MATLLELYTIEANAYTDPATATGDVLLAIQLNQKVRTAVVKRANIVIHTPLPGGEPQRSEALEQVAWAQRAVASPDGTAQTVFRLVLADNATFTPAQILAASDATIEQAITPVLGLLAKGMFPGR